MKVLFGLLVTGACLLAAVDGVVMNATTGKPQPSVLITLVQPQQDGMHTIASVKGDAEGKFHIDKELPPGPALLQAIYQGVVYTQVIPPGTPTTGVSVKVYDSTKNPESGNAAQHMILIEPSASALQISETFLYENKTQLTYSDPSKGSAQFYVPKEAEGKIQVTVNTSGGMPISRDAEKTKQPGIYKVDYPVKPGQTRFDVGYSLPAGDTFAGKNLDGGENSFLVTPPSVTLTGEGIDDLGQEPQTHAHTYRVRGATFEVKIEGTGSLREPTAAAAEEDTGQPQIEQAPARVYSKLTWVLALTLGVLALGGTMLFRKGTA